MGDPQATEHDSTAAGIHAVGAVLRERRELLGLSRRALAERLHMGIEQLQALEQGDLEHLNEPVFVKAAVRRVASHLELDADQLIGQLGSLAATTRKTTQRARISRESDRYTGFWRSTAWLSGVGLVGGAVAWIVLQPGLRPTATSAAISSRSTLVTLPVEARSVAPQPSAPPPLSAQTATLTLESVEPSWIALRRNGTVFFEGNLTAPLNVQEPETVEVYAGRPDLVTVSSGENPPESLGGISELRWYSLSPQR